MSVLDPKKLFLRLSQDIPKPLQKHLFIVGSLAAAYHFRSELERRGVNTKDADVVVYPAGDVRSAKALAVQLLDLGWKRTEKCFPLPRRSPAHRLRALRLFPPNSEDYFVELLMVSDGETPGPKPWVAVELSEGFFGLPGFEFLALTQTDRQRTPNVEGTGRALRAAAGHRVPARPFPR